MRPRILCVQPWIHDFAAYDLWIRPLGLLTLASGLRTSGVAVEFINCLDRRWSDDSNLPADRRPGEDAHGRGHFRYDIIDKPDCFGPVRRYFKRYGVPPGRFDARLRDLPRPDCALLTCTMTYWYPGAFEAIRHLRHVWPDLDIVLGGDYAMLCTDHARTHSGADRVVEEPGLKPALRAISKVLGRDMVDTLPDVESRPPRPAYDLLNHHGAAAVLTGRGCPYRCSYCASRCVEPGFRRLNRAHMAQTIRELARTCSITDVAFYDDALLADASAHLLPLLNDLSGLELHFHAPNGLHARFVTERVARRLSESNFCTLPLSFEPSDAGDGGAPEKVTGDELAAASDNLRSRGFSPDDFPVYTLIGLPGQTIEEAEETLHTIHSAGAASYLTRYSPVPHTPDFERLSRSYRQKAEREPLLHNNTAFPYVSKEDTLGPEEYGRLKDLSRRLNNRLHTAE